MQRPHGAAEDAMQRSRAGCCDGPASAWHVAGEGEHTCYTAPRRKLRVSVSTACGRGRGNRPATRRKRRLLRVAVSTACGRGGGEHTCCRCSHNLAAHRGRSRRHAVHHESAASAGRRGKACVPVGDARNTTAWRQQARNCASDECINRSRYSAGRQGSRGVHSHLEQGGGGG